MAPAQNRPIAVLPIETVRGGIVFVDGTLGSDRETAFLVDTGAAGNLIDRATAVQLGMRMGRGVASVSGAPSLDVGVIADAPLSVGPLTLRSRLVAADLSGLEPVLGRPVKSILGGEFLSRYVAEWDYEQKKLRLNPTDGFQYRGAGRAAPLTLIEGIPFVRGCLNLPNGKRIEGLFLVDSGAGGSAVQIFREAAVRTGAMDGLALLADTGLGIGGATPEQVARGTSLEIGPFRLSQPVAIFTDDTSGPNSGPLAVGLIGAEVLSRFRVTMDYSRRRMYLEPNHGFDDVFWFDVSGLRLRAGPPAFTPPVVSRVRDSSPAAEAGIRAGDTLTRIDGQTTSSLSLEEVREKLKKPGETHRLTLLRGDQTIEATLRTRDLLP